MPSAPPLIIQAPPAAQRVPRSAVFPGCLLSRSRPPASTRQHPAPAGKTGRNEYRTPPVRYHLCDEPQAGEATFRAGPAPATAYGAWDAASLLNDSGPTVTPRPGPPAAQRVAPIVV